MLPFQAAHYTKVPTWEGKIAWPYLDTHKDASGNPAPLVTIGEGCAIGLPEALTLPFIINGGAASQTQIQAEYVKVRSMAPARLPNFYEYPGCLILPEAGIAALVQKRYNAFTAELVQVFPDFLSSAWPVTAQTGALDLIWGVGEGHPATPQHVATGLMEYTHWLAYARAHNWAECAETCAEDPNIHAYDLRNAWRRSLFLQAAQAVH